MVLVKRVKRLTGALSGRFEAGAEGVEVFEVVGQCHQRVFQWHLRQTAQREASEYEHFFCHAKPQPRSTLPTDRRKSPPDGSVRESGEEAKLLPLPPSIYNYPWSGNSETITNKSAPPVQPTGATSSRHAEPLCISRSCAPAKSDRLLVPHSLPQKPRDPGN